ncbi:16S rRNA (uracil(1498)-N(3))-methyltransferase [Cognatilysobacter bugurensis]|uniref:Ribosomal RNA small subunit methyltransferase E n=1 Tax=Cognatilysobacter bugurensis TaxID=543356 RepID=A0A918T3F2_9GAMM|nr:16S rRNA (uracil(1498)-N(3))-methyltransferase [Lysobacter bugurensis]GHA88769.1 ribosomal RNA small subunit methyltransferase E [Lysobacter bugurensis]
MRMTRAYVDLPLHVGADVVLPEAPAAHLTRVLRLQAGDACVLFNGDGRDYTARLVAVGKREVRAAIDGAAAVERESPLRTGLLQGVARGEKMDLILQKATELGVSEVRPLWSQRSEVKLDEARAVKRHAHWRGVVIAACEQSGRARVPDVAAPVSLAAALAALPTGGTRVLLDPEGDTAIRTLDPVPGTLWLAVGPEGGWSPADRDQLIAAGFIGVRLGPRILRTETAGLAALAALQATHGDLG